MFTLEWRYSNSIVIFTEQYTALLRETYIPLKQTAQIDSSQMQLCCRTSGGCSRQRQLNIRDSIVKLSHQMLLDFQQLWALKHKFVKDTLWCESEDVHTESVILIIITVIHSNVTYAGLCKHCLCHRMSSKLHAFILLYGGGISIHPRL